MLPGIKICHLVALGGSVGTCHRAQKPLPRCLSKVPRCETAGVIGRSKTSFDGRRLEKSSLITTQTNSGVVRISETMSVIFCTVSGPAAALKF